MPARPKKHRGASTTIIKTIILVQVIILKPYWGNSLIIPIVSTSETAHGKMAEHNSEDRKMKGLRRLMRVRNLT